MHTVLVPWDDRNGTLWWNETCAKVLEHFGLPGGRYTSHPSQDQMTFNFFNEYDALLCKILLSDRL
jgi:hypothetical protein